MNLMDAVPDFEEEQSIQCGKISKQNLFEVCKTDVLRHCEEVYEPNKVKVCETDVLRHCERLFKFNQVDVPRHCEVFRSNKVKVCEDLVQIITERRSESSKGPIQRRRV